MKTGYFYFLSDSYYEKFKNCYIPLNKPEDNFGQHGRPCFYCFKENDIYWMVPISSQLSKYKSIYEKNLKKYKGNYDGIRFGYVNGKERAFLIQNLCPTTEEYIEGIYCINKGTVEVTINENLSKELNSIVRKVVRLYHCGTKIVFTDLKTILEGLGHNDKNEG